MAAIVLGFLVVLCVAPLGAALTELFTDPGALLQVVMSARVMSLLGSTVAMGLTTAVVCCLVGVPVGRLLARSSGRWAGLLGLMIPLPLVLPPWMAGVAWASWLPLSGFWGAVFLLSASLWPLVALFAVRGFSGAGRGTDVATLAVGRRRARWAVELPLAAPSILSGALLTFVFAITDFGVVDFLSFADPQPFVVLSSEIFQKWARLESGAEAAAVSFAAIIPSMLALWGVLLVERSQQGRQRGQAREQGRRERPGVFSMAGLVLVLATMIVPTVVLVGWCFAAEDPGATLGPARDSVFQSLGVAVATGAAVAVLGVMLARLTLRWSPRTATVLLALVLAPLAAPSVMFAVGEIRLWNHPSNPLADWVYPSPLLLVLSLTGRYLSLGVLTARALLLRQDQGPYLAERLVPRSSLARLWVLRLPMLAPATGLAFSLGYLLSMRELDMIVLVPAGSGTLAHRIFSLVHIASDETTALLCVTLVALVLVPLAAARLLGVPGVDCGGPDGRP
ncbi:MAG: iron(III) transport system permease protein [Pseudohongiellaceae bacterium]|jgi:iron(III) transport system permease protein